ncbi:MAG: N-acetyltransferase [Gammaproteobacteria bacterium]|nr:N-acetyltransferase [Gammaproteobacteria bacterium]
MADVTITRELGPSRGRYVAKLAGFEGEAELTLVRLDGNRMLADHTLTPAAMRGRGIASALVERLVADARREGFKVVPQCPFVVAQFDRHAEWSDVRA